MTTAATDTEAEAETTDGSHSSPALVGVDRGGRSAPARAGDTKAVGKEVGRLFSEHGRLVFALCNVLLRDREEAEDATQQCFLSAQTSLLAGTVPADEAAWLAAIARNESLSRLRRRRPATVALRDDDLLTETDVADLVDRRTEIAALAEAIAGLPPAQRQAVILRDFYGLSYREVSVALGVTGPAVESLLFKSRKRLQHRLRPFHTASGVAAVPAAIHEALDRAIPGFSRGVRSAGAPAGGAALSAKLLSGQAAAKIAVLALAAGAGAIALAHGPAGLFRRASKPIPISAVPKRVAFGPDVALAAPVTRPPDAIARPLRMTHFAPASRTHTTAHKTAPAPPRVVVLPPLPRHAATAPPPRLVLPKTVAGSAAVRESVTPAAFVPKAHPVPRTRPQITSAHDAPTIPATPPEGTPTTSDRHDGAGAASISPAPNDGSPPAPSAATPTDPGQGSGETSADTGASPDGSVPQGTGGADDQPPAVAPAPQTTAMNVDSARHDDGEHGTTSEGETGDSHTTTSTTTTTTTGPAATTAPTTTTTTDG
jgi:RNA polymerase sigma-70 factor (ECF subfamily)